MATRFAHDDDTTVPVEWDHGGAQTPTGVPGLISWNVGLGPQWGIKKRRETSSKTDDLIQRSVAQPHGPMQLTKWMKDGEPGEDLPKKRLAADCVH